MTRPLRFNRLDGRYVSGAYVVELEKGGAFSSRVWAVRCSGNLIGRAATCRRAKLLAADHASGRQAG